MTLKVTVAHWSKLKAVKNTKKHSKTFKYSFKRLWKPQRTWKFKGVSNITCITGTLFPSGGRFSGSVVRSRSTSSATASHQHCTAVYQEISDQNLKQKLKYDGWDVVYNRWMKSYHLWKCLFPHSVCGYDTVSDHLESLSTSVPEILTACRLNVQCSGLYG